VTRHKNLDFLFVSESFAIIKLIMVGSLYSNTYLDFRLCKKVAHLFYFHVNQTIPSSWYLTYILLKA
jgi:hypothetical protein